MSDIVKVANQSTIVYRPRFHQSTIVDTFLSFVLFFQCRLHLEFFKDQLKSFMHPLEFIRDRYKINHLTRTFLLLVNNTRHTLQLQNMNSSIARI
jgi:hypothetical protein